jgi:hypothetical protein
VPTHFSFRPLKTSDLELVHEWMQLPHARLAYGHEKLAEVKEEYGKWIAGLEPIHAYLVLADDKPIGTMSWNRFRDYPEMTACYQVADPNAVNCDVLLGEMAHRGLGPGLIRRFLREIVFVDETVTACVIDPYASNAIAIRAYAKAGFSFVREVIDFEDHVPLHLMTLARADLERPLEVDAVVSDP